MKALFSISLHTRKHVRNCDFTNAILFPRSVTYELVITSSQRCRNQSELNPGCLPENALIDAFVGKSLIVLAIATFCASAVGLVEATEAGVCDAGGGGGGLLCLLT